MKAADPALEGLAAAGIAAVFGLWSAAIQQPVTHLLLDASQYYLMADQLAGGRPAVAESPFVFRLGMPWLVARLWPHDTMSGFRLANLACSLAIAVLLVWWLRSVVAAAAVRLGLVALYAAAWHGPVRYVHYNAGYVDPLFLLLAIAGLIVMERSYRGHSGGLLVASLTLVSVAGVFVRESMLMIPLSALWAPPRAPHESRTLLASLWWAALVAVAAGLGAFGLTHLMASAVGDRSFAGTLAQQIWKSPFDYLLAWLVAYGPVLAILVFDWRAAARDLVERRYWLSYLFLCGVLSFIGGSDTERFAFWAMPVVYALLGRAIERRYDVVRGPLVAGGLLLAQAISARIFWSIPDTRFDSGSWSDGNLINRVYGFLDRLIVIDHFHWNLWSSFGSQPFRLLRLALYLTVIAILAWSMGVRASRAGRSVAANHERPAVLL